MTDHRSKTQHMTAAVSHIQPVTELCQMFSGELLFRFSVKRFMVVLQFHSFLNKIKCTIEQLFGEGEWCLYTKSVRWSHMPLYGGLSGSMVGSFPSWYFFFYSSKSNFSHVASNPLLQWFLSWDARTPPQKGSARDPRGFMRLCLI